MSHPDLSVSCPKCGSDLGFASTFKAYCCKAGCGLAVPRTVATYPLDSEEITELLLSGSLGPIKGFRSKMGRVFKAKLTLSEKTEWMTKFDYGQDGAAAVVQPTFDKNNSTLVAEKCPVCELGGVYDAGPVYVCEHSRSQPKKCSFAVPKVVLQREISIDDVRKICGEGKTELLTKFISRKGRPFSAFLVFDKKSGKIIFEFETLQPKATNKKNTIPDKQ